MKYFRTKRRDHRAGSTNVYADLGYKNPEDMLVRAQLVSGIAELLGERHLHAALGYAIPDEVYFGALDTMMQAAA